MNDLDFMKDFLSSLDIKNPSQLNVMMVHGQEVGMYHLVPGKNHFLPAVRVNDKAFIQRGNYGFARVQEDIERFVPPYQWEGTNPSLEYYKDLLADYVSIVGKKEWKYSVGVSTQATSQPVPTRAEVAGDGKLRFTPPYGEEAVMVKPVISQVSIDLSRASISAGEYTPHNWE